MRQQNQQKNMRGSTVLYILLALAVIALIVTWTMIKSRDATIVELEQMNEDSNTEIASLNNQLATADKNYSELSTSFSELTDYNTDVKKQLSFARAANQRSRVVKTARANLASQATELKSQIAELSTETSKIAPLKRNLSFANASNMRLSHVAEARDNLMVEVKETKAINSALSEEVAKLPGLKSKLSFSNAANSRLMHIKEARGNLMVINKSLQAVADKVPGLEQELDAATTENTRLRVIEDATKTFIKSIGDSVSPDAEQTSTESTESSEVLGALQPQSSADESAMVAAHAEALAAAEKKRSFAAADAQRAHQRLKVIPKLTASLATVTAENESLKQENAVIPVLKKELSMARAQVQRHGTVARARQNLMGQLQGANVRIAELDGANNALAAVKKELSYARASNRRLENVSNARDNLMVQLKDAKSTIASLEGAGAFASQSVAEAERARSFAAADAQRAKFRLSSMPKLIAAMDTLKQENSVLKDQNAALASTKKELSYARASNNRLQNISNARDNLMGQLRDAKSTIASLEGTGAYAMQSVAEAEMKRSLAAAEAQRAATKLKNLPRLSAEVQSLTAKNDQLAAQVSTIPALKKDLSMARAEVQRMDLVKQARANLMGQLKAVSLRAAEPESEPTVAVVEPEVVPEPEVPEVEETVETAQVDVQAETQEPIARSDSELQQKLDEIKPELQQNIVFASGSAWVNFKARKTLDKVAALMEQYPDEKITVDGHTDTIGRAAVNKVLSQTRAERVMEYLISRDIDPARLTARGFGSEKPLSRAKSAESQIINRRVEFTVE